MSRSEVVEIPFATTVNWMVEASISSVAFMMLLMDCSMLPDVANEEVVENQLLRGGEGFEVANHPTAPAWQLHLPKALGRHRR